LVRCWDSVTTWSAKSSHTAHQNGPTWLAPFEGHATGSGYKSKSYAYKANDYRHLNHTRRRGRERLRHLNCHRVNRRQHRHRRNRSFLQNPASLAMLFSHFQKKAGGETTWHLKRDFLNKKKERKSEKEIRKKKDRHPMPVMSKSSSSDRYCLEGELARRLIRI
jgi:hypothetical protein